MLGLGFSPEAAAFRRRGRIAPPEWPEGAVALWLILGQSNAQGYAPWRQDPARADPGAAVAALSPQERAAHPWMRFTIAGADPSAGRFRAEGHGFATEERPRTSPKEWDSGGHGIPADTASFGPEIGLLRHVLSGAAPASWRDADAPKLYLFKQTEGARSVDHFRWGGPGKALVLDALREAGGENLGTLAAAKTVLVQGVIFVIGEKDANDPRPGGAGTMADTLVPRFADWVRQIRGALGVAAPVAFVEIHDALDARKRAVNAGLAALAATLPDAAVIARQPDWSEVGDGVHYDAGGQDRIGAAVFGHFRETYGRSGDGLVTGYVFEGLKPWFHVPPVFVEDNGSQMRIAVNAAVSGIVHARVTAAGEPAPSAETIRDLAGAPGGFSRNVTADQDLIWFSPGGAFAAGVAQDCHFALEGADGALGERVTVRRSANVKFAPGLSAVSVSADSAAFTLRPSFPGTLHWSLLPGDRGWMRPDDVEAMAFLPAQAGSLACTAGQDASLTFAGLQPGSFYTLFVTGRRTSDGARSVTQRAAFSTL